MAYGLFGKFITSVKNTSEKVQKSSVAASFMEAVKDSYPSETIMRFHNSILVRTLRAIGVIALIASLALYRIGLEDQLDQVPTLVLVII